MAFPFTTSNAFYPNAATFLPANPIPGPQYSAPSSPTSESTALSQDQTPPRPQNKWLIFRNAMMKRLPPREHGRAYTQGEISSILSKKWAARSAEEDAYYTAEAERADAEHKLKYPGYKYKRAAKKEKGGKVKEGSYGVQKRSKGAPRRRTSSPRSQGSRSASGSRAPSPPTSGTSTPNAPQQDNAVAGPSRIPGSLALVDMPPQPVLQVRDPLFHSLHSHSLFFLF
ncbi:hypothetical protein DENSPDRAFT_411774 [Dentipellis sp. KUC8613]|nr:hypothetical protein DENSPDRAFT_411774 [Dentipellis sp. KUC8613]